MNELILNRHQLAILAKVHLKTLSVSMVYGFFDGQRSIESEAVDALMKAVGLRAASEAIKHAVEDNEIPVHRLWKSAQKHDARLKRSEPIRRFIDGEQSLGLGYLEALLLGLRDLLRVRDKALNFIPATRAEKKSPRHECRLCHANFGEGVKRCDRCGGTVVKRYQPL